MKPFLSKLLRIQCSCCVLVIGSSLAAAVPAEEAPKQSAKYSQWQFQPAKSRYWCTYEYTNAAGRPSFQYVLFYPDEDRRGLYYWESRTGQIWACCVRPGAPSYNRYAMKWYRQDRGGKWMRRKDGECPSPPDGGRPIATREDGPLPIPPPPREFDTLSAAERKLAQRFHEGLAEITIEKGQIVALDFAANEISDKLLADLRDTLALRRLYLDSTNLTDNGLKHISGAGGLTHLDISQTQVSDAGLKHLAGMKSLQTLVARGCGGISSAGVRELRKSLPKLLITGPGEGSSIAVP